MLSDGNRFMASAAEPFMKFDCRDDGKCNDHKNPDELDVNRTDLKDTLEPWCMHGDDVNGKCEKDT